ncbi:NHL repeat containing protein [Oopsacas minuta]|uniref:NHL repeat containing protein n=1 Tax=Oopsacas minuta TaxID=111878 RepID=A0AAV7JGU0_9METZ|nr:NHL repeat containing protein [Oopsacas minuta]
MATANSMVSTERNLEFDLNRDNISRVNYKNKIQPLLNACVGGRRVGQFSIHMGPYVSSFCIIKYQLDGRYICRIGTDGEDEMEFTIPYGLTVDKSNGDIYICDTGNERVQILTNALTFKSQFGKDLLSSPLDVKLTEYFIFVMDDSNPCLHLFDYNLILQKSIISKGPGMQVTESYSYSFFIDNSRNILIPDQESNAILIFNPLYELIHKISVNKNPFGITADDEGRIIVIVSCTDWNWLQIF